MNRTLFILIIALIWGMTFVGCDNGTTSGVVGDTWSNITSLSQLDGTWKTTYDLSNKSIKEFVEELGMEWDDQMQFMVGNMQATSSADVTLTINAREKTLATSMVSTATFTGGNINILWPMLKLYSGILEEEGITINFFDSTHTINMTYNSPAEEIPDDAIEEMLASGLQINQRGTKIKVPANYGEGIPELIFIKQ